MVSISVVNVVGRLDFQQEFDLPAVAELLTSSDLVSEVRYNPEDNHWIQSWFPSPTTDVDRYVSFYRSGVAMVTGCDSVEEFTAVAEMVEDVMSPAVTAEVLTDIRNIVVTGAVEQTFDLSRLAITLGLETVEYEPEQFPGLIHRDPNRDCIFLVFTSGKVVCTGLKRIDVAESRIESYVLELSECLKPENQPV